MGIDDEKQSPTVNDKSAEAILPNRFPDWKTVTIGGYQNAEQYKRTASQTGCHIGDWASDILESPNFIVTQEKEQIVLAIVTVAELGLTKGGSYHNICTNASKFGMQLCPAEIGPALRLAYKEQPDGEAVAVAMKAVQTRSGGLYIFTLGRNGENLWLRGSFGHRNFFWYPDQKFVFARLSSAAQ